jgi:excisionase family DNA binding protein
MNDLLPTHLPPLLTVAEFRNLTRTSRGFAYKLIRDGTVGSVRLGRRRAIRIPRSALAQFISSRSVAQASEQ